MKKVIPIILIAALAEMFISCSHKSASAPVIYSDTSSSASYQLYMYPAIESLYNLNGPYQMTIEHGLQMNVPLVITKQIKSIGGSASQAVYQFSFQRDTSMSASFPIVTDSLISKNYYYDSIYVHNYPNPSQFLNFSLNGISSTVFYQTDNLNVNITSYTVAGKVSGNFSVRLTPVFNALNYSNRGSVQLIEGRFNNISVVYK